MIRIISKDSKALLCIFFSLLLLVLGFVKESNAASCMPSCSSDDGRLIALAEGAIFSTFTPTTLNVRLSVPGGSNSFSIGIFDGDGQVIPPGTLGFWDAGTPDSPYTYKLRIDPDGDNGGQIVLDILSDNLPNNDWEDFTLPVHESALDENGNYSYVLSISHLNDAVGLNGFKLRSSGSLFINEIFSFTSQWTTADDIALVFPNFNFDDGLGPEDRVGANYDGTVSFFFEVPEGAGEIFELSLWDADCDHGNFDGTDFDTDDPNTPNDIPSFAPMDSDAIAEGANAPPNPFDDMDMDGISFMNVFPPAVKYTVIFPDGQEYENANPSGNREWEMFTLSTITNNPAIADFQASSIPAGIYEVRFEGLDMQNLCAIRPPLPFTLFGEVIPDPEVPPESVSAISEWGLLAMALALGIIGIAVVRRRQQIS